MGSAIGAVGGGLLGLIGGPVGVLAWIVGGAVVANAAGNVTAGGAVAVGTEDETDDDNGS